MKKLWKNHHLPENHKKPTKKPINFCQTIANFQLMAANICYLFNVLKFNSFIATLVKPLSFLIFVIPILVPSVITMNQVFYNC